MRNTKVIIPKDIDELKNRCRKISGKKIGLIASELNINIPSTLHHTKGFLGQIFEVYLGANANTKPLPDFIHLGIELKTLPINEKLKPQESTYVCRAPMYNNKKELKWEESRVKKKLSHVLWVPIQANKSIPIEDRVIGTPFLWKPTKNQELDLKSDWEELTNMLHLGNIENVSAKYGKYLQLRPKAANSSILVDSLDQNGNRIKVVPRGFYLRASFTNQILTDYFC